MNKYEQIINYYRQQIVDKLLKPGDQLPNEIEIAQAFKVSRMTANKALNIPNMMFVLKFLASPAWNRSRHISFSLGAKASILMFT